MENNYSIEIDNINYSIDINKDEYILEIKKEPDIAIELNKQGPPGSSGNGIDHIEVIEETHLYTKYRIVYTDQNVGHYDYIVYNGIDLEPAQEYIYEQAEPSNEWVIEHNLNTHPSITVVDDSGNVVDGDWNYRDSNTIVLNFTAPFSGVAYLNYTR